MGGQMKRSCFIFLIALFFKFSSGLALNAPDLKCLEILSSGAVTLTWQTPSDLTGFVRYSLYTSTSNYGNFTLVDQITDPTQTQYTHTSANANYYQVLYYYLVSESTSSVYHSDTLSTIVLNLTNSMNGTAILQWNKTLQYVPENSYHVYRMYPAEAWAEVKTINTEYVIDTVYACESKISYQIRYAEDGCFSTSAIRQDMFKNTMTPQMPAITAVTVGLTESLNHILWPPSEEKDIYAYIVYYQENDVWIPVDTLYGQENTIYTDSLRNPYQGIYAYRISAMDSCFNASPMSVYQTNFQINKPTFDDCENTYTLSWTAYENNE